MKKYCYIATLLAIAAGACKEKEVQCSAMRYKTPCNITFGGFTSAELDTLVLKKYAVSSGFSQLMKTDTIVNINDTVIDGYGFASAEKNAFAAITASNNYELLIPATATTYQLSNVAYGNDTLVLWTAKRNCGTYGTFTLPPQSVTVNGMQQGTVRLPVAAGTSWLALSR